MSELISGTVTAGCEILLVEDGVFDIYGRILSDRLHELGCKTEFLATSAIIRRDGWVAARIWGLQHCLKAGPAVARLNREILSAADRHRPKWVLLWRDDLVYSSTILRLKKRGIMVAVYNNDNPVNGRWPRYAWRRSISNLPLYDHVFSYRPGTIDEFYRLGARQVSLLGPWYDRSVHRRLDDPVPERFRSQVAFIGHWRTTVVTLR